MSLFLFELYAYMYIHLYIYSNTPISEYLLNLIMNAFYWSLQQRKPAGSACKREGYRKNNVHRVAPVQLFIGTREITLRLQFRPVE